MAGDAENMHNAFPDRLAAERFFDRHRLEERGLAAVVGFDGVF